GIHDRGDSGLAEVVAKRLLQSRSMDVARLDVRLVRRPELSTGERRSGEGALDVFTDACEELIPGHTRLELLQIPLDHRTGLVQDDRRVCRGNEPGDVGNVRLDQHHAGVAELLERL